MDASALSEFCEVYIPQAPSVFTYGIPEGAPVRRGSVVWVQLANRKKPVLALVSKVTSVCPECAVRGAYPHASGYVFNERYMEMLEWTSRYYMSTPMKALDVFWPADFEKYLDALAAGDALFLEGDGMILCHVDRFRIHRLPAVGFIVCI